MRQRVDWLWVFLSPRGRLTRAPYVLATVLILVITSAIVQSYINANTTMTQASVAGAATVGELMEAIINATPGLGRLLQLVAIVTAWPMIALSAKRMQDLGLSGFFGVLILVPGIAMLAFFALALVAGKNGANRFGAVRNAPPTA